MSPETREKNLDAACAVDGWLTRQEAELLHDLAHNADESIIEIGSWMGRSTTALALGAMNGKKATVYAVDPFTGTQHCPRGTSTGTMPVGNECSPELLRSNLDRAGINGQVKIIAKPSYEATADVPAKCSLLFVDGNHEYNAVCKDLDDYLPKVKIGGFAVLHDVHGLDMGVVRAVDDRIRSVPNTWRIIDHVDSAMVLRRVNTERRTIKLLCPGGSYGWGPLTSIVQSSLGAHRVDLDNNGNGWDDFNALWARAMNSYEAGECTHVAMLHADIRSQPGFIDILMDEMDERDLDFLSVACAMKDRRAICNCGIAVDNNRWGAWRRLAVKELKKLPPTFTLDDLKSNGFCAGDDKVLLHNTGCFIADLRKPCFWETYKDRGIEPWDSFVHEQGDLQAWFAFPTKIVRDKESGKWINYRESEDWFFSRQLHRLGAKSAITRKVGLTHIGHNDYDNHGEWGTNDCDEDTKNQWGPTCS